MKRHVFAISLIVLGLCLLGVNASAQIDKGFFRVNYFANNGVAGAPDATVRIDDPDTGDVGNLCAMIYVFDNDQQLSECCGCLVTPDGLRTLSVSHDLTSNPLTGVVSNNGVIKIVSANPELPCNPAIEFPLQPTLREWASHVENKVGTAYPITETEFSSAALSEQEFLFNLVEQCSFAQRLGSGHAVCSCGTGD